MLELLDLRTIVAVTGVMACLMSLVIHAQRRSYPASIRGLDHWAAGPLIAFVSTVLFGLRGVLPEWLSVGAANALLFVAVGLLLAGSMRFFGQALPRWFLPALLLLAAAVAGGLLAYQGRYVERVLFMCLLLGAVNVWHAALLWRQQPKNFAIRFTLAVLLLLAVTVLFRAIAVLLEPPVQDLFAPSPSQAVYVLSLSFGLLLLPIGSVLMASERLREELEKLATQDALTGTFTRRALFELGEYELARGRRSGTPVAVLMMDIDHFKDINDRHGHRVGDAVIRVFADRAGSVLRAPAILGRYGGEEFVAVLPDSDSAQARLAAERIRHAAGKDGSLPRFTISIGIAVCGAPHEQTLAELIDRADVGLYRAKRLGRDRIEEDGGEARDGPPAAG